jgi:hypothetical protein
MMTNILQGTCPLAGAIAKIPVSTPGTGLIANDGCVVEENILRGMIDGNGEIGYIGRKRTGIRCTCKQDQNDPCEQSVELSHIDFFSD